MSKNVVQFIKPPNCVSAISSWTMTKQCKLLQPWKRNYMAAEL